MSVDYAAYSGKSNTGFHMKVNEDYILFNDEDFDGSLFACIADGSGSKDTLFRPAAIVSHQLQKSLIRLYRERKDLVESNLRFFMEEAFQTANDVLIGFKLGDEAERLQDCHHLHFPASFLIRMENLLLLMSETQGSTLSEMQKYCK